MEEMCILGAELAQELLEAGFELIRIQQGKYADYYYFVDTIELEEYLIKLFQ